MDFYQMLNDYYDIIFPLDPAMSDFLERQFSPQQHALLDVGCATGTMACHLATRGYWVTGIDLDDGLLAAAWGKAKAKRLTVDFQCRSMTGIGAAFDPDNFDGAYCVGNTLVHLPDTGAVREVAAQLHHVIRPGGTLLIQIINYDRILRDGVDTLPTVERAELSFARQYTLIEGMIEFTGVIIRREKPAQPLRRSVMLLPLTKAALASALYTAGWQKITFFSGFDESPWTPDGFLTVAAAVKPA